MRILSWQWLFLCAVVAEQMSADDNSHASKVPLKEGEDGIRESSKENEIEGIRNSKAINTEASDELREQCLVGGNNEECAPLKNATNYPFEREWRRYLVTNRGALDDGGWNATHFYDFELRDIDRCDFPRIAMSEINNDTDWSMPLVITNMTLNQHLIDFASKRNMLERYADKEVVLSNSVSSAHGRKTVKFSEYVEYIGTKEPLENVLQREANYTWYLCGDNWWPEMIKEYKMPKWLPGVEIRTSLSFGLGGSSSGIPLHHHGPALLEIFSGRKRWFTAPPFKMPPFDPNLSSFRWFHGEEDLADVQMCTQHVGEALYLPEGWWHATMNVGETLFYLLFT